MDAIKKLLIAILLFSFAVFIILFGQTPALRYMNLPHFYLQNLAESLQERSRWVVESLCSHSMSCLPLLARCPFDRRPVQLFDAED